MLRDAVDRSKNFQHYNSTGKGGTEGEKSECISHHEPRSPSGSPFRTRASKILPRTASERQLKFNEEAKSPSPMITSSIQSATRSTTPTSARTKALLFPQPLHALQQTQRELSTISFLLRS